MHIPTFIVGMITAGIGVWLTCRVINSNKSCTEKAEGTVTGHRNVSVRGSSGAKFYYENVAYTVNGMEYTHKRKAGLSSPQYSVGEKLVLLYNPANPKKSRLEVDKNVAFPVLGPVIVILGIAVILFAFTF